MAKVHPWERQAGETVPAFEAFAKYRDLGVKRSTEKVARELGKSTTLMHRWSAQHSWVERCRAWDMEQDRLWREEQAEARRTSAKARGRIAAAMLQKVVARLQTLDADKLSPRDLEAWVRTASMVEQQAYGVDDETDDSVKQAAGVITELVRGLRGQP